MEQVTGPGAIGRPRVVVSVGTSVDGRVTLRRDRLLMNEDASRGMEFVVAAQRAGTGGSAFVATCRPLSAAGGPRGERIVGRRLCWPIDRALDRLRLPLGRALHRLSAEEVAERPDHEKWFTVVDSRGRVEWHTKGGGGFDVLVLVARATPAEYLAYLRRERICYLVVGEERVDLAVALRRMQDRLGVTCVVSTAGGGLNGALLRAGLVDEIQLLILPAAIGGLGTPTLFDGPELADGDSPTRLRLLFAHAETDGMLWLRYEVIHEAPTE
jgi:2,5-diamino-6-(ribosylamino)-4(3H)-pyrimidinone 5'-phosphate reductase